MSKYIEERRELIINDLTALSGDALSDVVFKEGELYITQEVFDEEPTKDSTNLMTSGAIYNAMLGLEVKAPAVTATIATSSWTSTTEYGYSYKCNMTARGVTADNTVIVGLSANSTAAQEKVCLLSGIQCKSQSKDTVTLYAKQKPTASVSITVLILGQSIT